MSFYRFWNMKYEDPHNNRQKGVLFLAYPENSALRYFNMPGSDFYNKYTYYSLPCQT